MRKLKLLTSLAISTITLSSISNANAEYNYVQFSGFINSVVTHYTVDVAQLQRNDLELLKLRKDELTKRVNYSIYNDYLSGCPVINVIKGDSGLINAQLIPYVDIDTIHKLIDEQKAKVPLNIENCKTLKINRERYEDIGDILSEAYSKYYDRKNLLLMNFQLNTNYDFRLGYQYLFKLTQNYFYQFPFYLGFDVGMSLANYTDEVLKELKFNTLGYDASLVLRQDYFYGSKIHPYASVYAIAGFDFSASNSSLFEINSDEFGRLSIRDYDNTYYGGMLSVGLNMFKYLDLGVYYKGTQNTRSFTIYNYSNYTENKLNKTFFVSSFGINLGLVF